MARRSDHKNALANPTQHALVPNVGYVMYDSPLEQLRYGPDDQTKCDPPTNAADGSSHLLSTPRGGPALAFTWHGSANAWMRPSGKRVGFHPGYLSSHGWRYLGPVAA